MYFCHSTEIWRDYPELVAGALLAKGITKEATAGDQVAKYKAVPNLDWQRAQGHLVD